MPARIVVAAVLVLAALAAGDALRGGRSVELRAVPRQEPRAADVELVRGDARGHVADGRLAQSRVLRAGREVIGAEKVKAAFPGAPRNALFDVVHIAVTPDGTIVLAVVALPLYDSSSAALELWREGRLTGSFRVPPGSFAGGLGFSSDGRRLATWSADGRTTLYSRSGRQAASMR